LEKKIEGVGMKNWRFRPIIALYFENDKDTAMLQWKTNRNL